MAFFENLNHKIFSDFTSHQKLFEYHVVPSGIAVGLFNICGGII